MGRILIQTTDSHSPKASTNDRAHARLRQSRPRRFDMDMLSRICACEQIASGLLKRNAFSTRMPENPNELAPIGQFNFVFWVNNHGLYPALLCLFCGSLLHSFFCSRLSRIKE
jgi:hypothetical protein